MWQAVADERVENPEAVLSWNDHRRIERRQHVSFEQALLIDVRGACTEGETAAREVADLDRQTFRVHSPVAQERDRLARVAGVLVTRADAEILARCPIYVAVLRPLAQCQFDRVKRREEDVGDAPPRVA